MTWSNSTTRRVDSNRSPIPSARDCHPCLRNDCYRCLRNEVLPMSPEWTSVKMAPQAGFGPARSEPQANCGATGETAWGAKFAPRIWLAALDDFRNWLVPRSGVNRVANFLSILEFAMD